MPYLFGNWRWAHVIILVVATCIPTKGSHFADWSVLGGRPHEPACVDIPKTMSLCSDIGYDKMRLPNLLGHDTLAEVEQQSGSWVPLLNVRCHSQTKLFLCSLFTPVCVESQIYPCRTLCEEVQRGCEGRMRTYGYGWPDMLRCDKFPEDNDMCMKPLMDTNASEANTQVSSCEACNPVETYENILDNFCRAEFVVRTRVKQQRKSKVKLRKVKIFKTKEDKKKIRRSKLSLSGRSSCCDFKNKKKKYLIMGTRDTDGDLSPNFVMTWKRSKMLRQAVRMFKHLNCTDPNLFTPTADDGSIIPKAVRTSAAKKKRRKNKRNKNKENKYAKQRKNKRKKGNPKEKKNGAKKHRKRQRKENNE